MIQATDQPVMKENDLRLAEFERFEKEPKQPSWLFPLRKAGLARFGDAPDNPV